MGNIIISGFKTNKLITQGYHSAEAPAEPEAPTITDIGFPPRRKRKRGVLSPEILGLIKKWLELE